MRSFSVHICVCVMFTSIVMITLSVGHELRQAQFVFDSRQCYKLNVTRCNQERENCEGWHEQIKVCTLLQRYNHQVPPPPPPISKRSEPNDTATNIYSSARIQSITNINDYLMEFIVDLRFQQKWYDMRLAFDGSGNVPAAPFRLIDRIHLGRDQRIWIPDTFFQNEKDGWYHNIDAPNQYATIRSDGLVTYNRRMTLILACYLDLRKYPMDQQSCNIDFASYAYTTKDINYVWDYIPFLLTENATKALPNFVITDIRNVSCTSTTATGTYSCLRIRILFTRLFSSFLMQLYVPSTMLVVVSWVSYWIDWKVTAARVPISIVTLLSMITTSNIANANLPPVAYIKAIDVWVFMCTAMILYSLLEYAVVQCIGMTDVRRRQTQYRPGPRSASMPVPTVEEHTPGPEMAASYNVPAATINGENENDEEPFETSTAEDGFWRSLRRRRRYQMKIGPDETKCAGTDIPMNVYEKSMFKQENIVQRLLYRRKKVVVQLSSWFHKSRAERIDLISKWLIPILFVTFNVFYWLYYMVLFE